MNICLLTSTFLPQIGGRELAVHHLATALSRIGHNVVIVAPYHKDEKVFDNHQYRLIRFGFRGYGRLKLILPSVFFTLAKVVAKFSIDVINVHNIYTPGSWVYYFTQIYKKVPIVGTPHGDDILKLPSIQYGIRLDPKTDEIVYRNLRHFTLTTAISKSIRKELTEILSNNKKIRDIPNGIWVSHFQKKINKEEIRNKYKIPSETLALISVGRNNPVKGFQYGIDAIAKLKSTGTRISYILVGRHMSSIRELAQRLGLSDSVIMPGELNPERVIELLLASDIYVNTSLIESFGLTVLEAMGAGLPCIATNINSNKELISSQDGFFVEPGNSEQLANAIKYLIDNPSLREEMGTKASIKAQQYDWTKIAKMYIDAYSEAIHDAVKFLRLNPTKK